MKPIAEINVIPLVDVMLVLLTIVLTTASFVATGRIAVPLPKARHSATSLNSTPSIIIMIDAQRRLYVQDQAVADLPKALQTQARNTPVVVRAHAQLELEHFVALLDQVRGLGFAQISLQVQKR